MSFCHFRNRVTLKFYALWLTISYWLLLYRPNSSFFNAALFVYRSLIVYSLTVDEFIHGNKTRSLSVWVHADAKPYITIILSAGMKNLAMLYAQVAWIMHITDELHSITLFIKRFRCVDKCSKHTRWIWHLYWQTAVSIVAGMDEARCVIEIFGEKEGNGGRNEKVRSYESSMVIRREFLGMSASLALGRCTPALLVGQEVTLIIQS